MSETTLSQFLEWIEIAGNDDAKHEEEPLEKYFARRKAYASFATNYFDACATGKITEEMYQQICLKYIERHDDILQKRFDEFKPSSEKTYTREYSAVLCRAGMTLSEIGIDILTCDDVYHPERIGKAFPEEGEMVTHYEAIRHRSHYIGFDDIRKTMLNPDVRIFPQPGVIKPS